MRAALPRSRCLEVLLVEVQHITLRAFITSCQHPHSLHAVKGLLLIEFELLYRDLINFTV